MKPLSHRHRTPSTLLLILPMLFAASLQGKISSSPISFLLKYNLKSRRRDLIQCTYQSISTYSTTNTVRMNGSPIWSASTTPAGKASAIQLLRAGRWQLSRTKEGLEREFQFKSFSKAMKFINSVADECKVKAHHPEWANVYNRVQVRWTTHNPKGLSEKDVEMAKFCDMKAAELGEMDASKAAGKRPEGVTISQPAGEILETKNIETGSLESLDVLEGLLGEGEIDCEPCRTGKIDNTKVKRKTSTLSLHLEDTLGRSILEVTTQKRDQLDLAGPNGHSNFTSYEGK